MGKGKDGRSEGRMRVKKGEGKMGRERGKGDKRGSEMDKKQQKAKTLKEKKG